MKYFQYESFLRSYISFIFLNFKFSSYQERLKDRLNIKRLEESLEKNEKKRLAIFVAFHETKTISESNFNYLKILKRSFFEIIYVHNGPLTNDVRINLEEFGCHVICRENIGQDFGAWKDIILLINQYELNKKLDWILLCNDSNFCLGGNNTELFINKFSEILKNKEIDFVSLNNNYQDSIHHQSYFLCLSEAIFKSKKFKRFWNQYIPISNRSHAIRNGEIKFSKEVLSFFRQKVIYTSHELYQEIILNRNEYDQISSYLPKNSYKLKSYVNLDQKNLYKLNLRIEEVIDYLENFNQSHVFALLNILFLKNPFFKKNLVCSGTFSYGQIYRILNYEELEIDNKLKTEIMNCLLKKGTSYSFLGSLRLAAKNGIHPLGTKIDKEFR
tara:strand:- start:1053 stop:2210 length:1158 start_codon:yes stop_codon:yes gene_type:complete